MENLELQAPVSANLAAEICDSLQKTFGVDLKAIFESDVLEPKQKISRASIQLQEAIFSRAYEEQYEDFADYNALQGVELNKSIETEPNIAFQEKDLVYLSNLKGEDLKNFVYNLTKRFENMANAKTPTGLVVEMISGGIVSVGVPLAKAVIQNLWNGQALRVAMLNGVKSLGMKTAIAAIVFVLVALLYFLMVDNPKKILGLVVNGTDHDFVVKNYKSGGDLHMEHGQMVNFMEDHQDGLQSPMIQLKQRLSFGEGSEDNFVFAGVYFGDRNVGFRGSEGVMLFSATEGDTKFAHMFAVPYSKDNRTNIKMIQGEPNLSELYRSMYNEDKERVDFDQDAYHLTSTVNDRRGGVVAAIATIRPK